MSAKHFGRFKPLDEPAKTPGDADIRQPDAAPEPKNSGSTRGASRKPGMAGRPGARPSYGRQADGGQAPSARSASVRTPYGSGDASKELPADLNIPAGAPVVTLRSAGYGAFIYEKMIDK